MNKKVFIVGLLSLIGALLFSYAFAMKCRVCEDEYSKKHGITTPHVAYRDYRTPIIYKDNKSFATYRCPAGHKFLVCLKEYGDSDDNR